MVRLVTVNCPYTWRDEVSQVIAGLSKRHLIYQNIRSTADENTIYTFKTKDKHLQSVLEEINSVGCGRDYGHIDVMQVLLSRPPISTLGEVSGKKKRAYRVSERMTVDEISCFIDDGNHLTFNYMILLFMASLIAGTGLLTDSSTTVIASMLVSPLMGPILSITFGCAVRDWETIRRGMRNELVGIMISLVTGLVMGFVASFLYPSDYRSSEIVGRGEAINLIGGFIVALASGIAVVVAVTMGGVNAIVGTAISASLLPPIVNCGICLAMSLKYHFDDDSGHDAYQYSLFGSISFCLFLVNFATIVAVGYLTFRFVKDVRPEHKRVYSMSMDSTCTTSSDSSSKKRTSKIQLNPLQDVTANTHSQSDDEVKNKQ